MAVPDAVLRRPLAWREASLIPLLAQLQGNILKGHGRDHTRNLFLRFAGDPAQMRHALGEAGAEITSAIEQLAAVARYHADGTPGGAVHFLFFSAAGYRALEIADSAIPADPAFRAGMAARAAQLGDPDSQVWETAFRSPPDGLLLIGADTPEEADAEAARFAAQLAGAGITVIAIEAGTALRRGGPKGPGIEHFGYVDGRSQPLMLTDDVAREIDANCGPPAWDPAFGPAELAIVRDPGNPDEDAYGSYLVFRKLEQDVAGFDQAEQALAQILGMADDALAGAYLVGRFEDGTPVVESDHPAGNANAANGFEFGADPDGNRCPFQAHIRKVNPRGDSVRLGADLAGERSHLMPRRGIPFGTRAPDLSDKPRDGVGLLFMAYNQDIQRQFEFVQTAWVDNPDFARAGTGVDPVLGPAGAAAQPWPATWDDPATGSRPLAVSGFVRMRGGDYFFAPSIGFITSLSTRDE